MRKALIPMLASLALCGAGTLALIASNERAQANPRKPMMVAVLNQDAFLAQTLPDLSPGSDLGALPDFATNLKQFCDDRYAGEVGHMAYLKARLQLSRTEQPLFAHWRDVRLNIAKRHAADCHARITTLDQNQADPINRMNREESTLKQRISDLDVERPVLVALYAALTPEQRQALDSQRFFLNSDRAPLPPPLATGFDNRPASPPAR